MSDKLTVKLSSKSNMSSFIWCLGLHRDFLLSRNSVDVRVKLRFEDAKLYIVLGNEGNLLSTRNDTNLWVWMPISRKNLEGLKGPIGKWQASSFEGIYHQEEDVIEVLFPDGLPAPLAYATQGDKEEASDLFKVRPKRAVLQKQDLSLRQRKPASVPMLAERVGETLEPVTKSAASTLPDKLGLWSDDNVRALKRLLHDLQASRRDIVFSLEDGIVTIKKKTFSEM